MPRGLRSASSRNGDSGGAASTDGGHHDEAGAARASAEGSDREQQHQEEEEEEKEEEEVSNEGMNAFNKMHVLYSMFGLWPNPFAGGIRDQKSRAPSQQWGGASVTNLRSQGAYINYNILLNHHFYHTKTRPKCALYRTCTTRRQWV